MLASIIPSHRIAEWLLALVDKIIDRLTAWFGLSRSATLEEALYTVLVVGLAIVISWLVRRFVLWGCRRMLVLRKSAFATELLRQSIFTRCSHVIPPLIFLALLPFAFHGDIATLRVVRRCVMVYALIATGVAVNAILKFVWSRYDARANTKNHPLRGILNVAQGIVWIVVTIISVSVVVGKSPAYLLTGLGAFAAALMLIFKDSILGFVAGIQLSQNDMLRVGDWIVVPSTLANGVVEDVTLTVVKVRNFDNTLVMLPPYTLVSTSFQNWRGMSASGCRRICREVYIDNASIHALSQGEAETIAAAVPLIKEFVAKGSEVVYSTAEAGVNGTTETNLGLFRAYLCNYLLNHKGVSNDAQILVRLMQPVYYGTPLEVYCFTSTTDWTAYEAIQSEIFEHVSAAAPKFGLQIYNYADGSDVVVHQAQK